MVRKRLPPGKSSSPTLTKPEVATILIGGHRPLTNLASFKPSMEPAEAVDYLNRLGLDALLSMEGTNFWHVPGLDRPFDGKAFDRAFDVRCCSADILRVGEIDRALMVPKLAAKSSAIANGASPPELFVVRAKLAQIGWLETSWAAAAANAIFEIEFALQAAEAEDCRLIDHQLS